MADPISATPVPVDFTTRLRVGANYDWGNGMILPNPAVCAGIEGAEPFLAEVELRMTRPSHVGMDGEWVLARFPAHHDRAKEWLHGSEFFNGICLVARPSKGDYLDVAIVGCPLEVWTGMTLSVQSGYRRHRYRETRQVIFLPEDPLESPAEHREMSKYTGIHQVSPTHDHPLYSQGLGKAHRESEDHEARIKALEAKK